MWGFLNVRVYRIIPKNLYSQKYLKIVKNQIVLSSPDRSNTKCIVTQSCIFLQCSPSKLWTLGYKWNKVLGQKIHF